MKKCTAFEYNMPDSCELFIQGKIVESGYRESIESVIDGLSSKALALDIGAHIGIWTNWLADRFDAVHAYEPFPAVYECLELNTDGKSNVTLSTTAISDSAGTAYMANQIETNSGTNKIVSDTTDVQVNTNTLDALYGADDGVVVNFIRCDTLFHETAVITGALALIERDRPLVVCNLTYSQEYDAVRGMLLGLGYEEIGVDPNYKMFQYAG